MKGKISVKKNIKKFKEKGYKRFQFLLYFQKSIFWGSIFCVQTMVWLPVCLWCSVCAQMLMHVITQNGCISHVREFALKVFWEKIPLSCTGELNPHQYCTWLFNPTHYPLNSPTQVEPDKDINELYSILWPEAHKATLNTCQDCLLKVVKPLTYFFLLWPVAALLSHIVHHYLIVVDLCSLEHFKILVRQSFRCKLHICKTRTDTQRGLDR